MNSSSAPGAGDVSNLAADVVLALASGQKSFSQLLGMTSGWQSTMSAALASLLEDHFVERSGSAFVLTGRGCDLLARCRKRVARDLDFFKKKRAAQLAANCAPVDQHCS
jgi:hypothetical protein